jgi:hypothetical protein
MVDPLLAARPVDRVGDVLGRQRLAVGPLQSVAQRVGVREPVGGRLPRFGEAGDRGEVVGRLVGQGGVLQVPELERRHEEAGRHVRTVKILLQPDRQRDRLVVLGGRAAGQSGGERNGGHDPGAYGDGETPHHWFSPGVTGFRPMRFGSILPGAGGAGKFMPPPSRSR